jgi:hypothetical protein
MPISKLPSFKEARIFAEDIDFSGGALVPTICNISGVIVPFWLTRFDTLAFRAS